MNCFIKYSYPVCLILICFLVGCKPEVTVPIVTTPVVLDGEWEMVEAYKGNTLSRLLDNATFKFTDEGKFSTNILGDENMYPYELSKGKIKVLNPNKDIYIVQHKTTDTLILSTRQRNFDFKFITVLSKSEKSNIQ